MEISLISDSVTTIASIQSLGPAKYLIHRRNLTSNNVISISDSLSEQQLSSTIISAVIFPVDAVAPPPVKPSHLRTAPRTLLRKRRRTKRRSLTDGGDEDDGDYGFFGDASDGGGFGNGPFGGGGGRGWNFDRFGGSNWEEWSSNSFSDPAFDFVYEVLCWIVLSNCLHFAFKKVVRIVADGIGDPAREKVAMRITPIC
ncbi:unnamed protein product [Ilex paraguariensis]|uniref:Uncharacterized protein n=1 Tax=Ilex paraguariensis TaxID=185542 RepID=A0ABC8RKW2_9AQUA